MTKRMGIRLQLSPLACANSCSMASRYCRKGFKMKPVSLCFCWLVYFFSFSFRTAIHGRRDLPYSPGTVFQANFTRFYILARSIDGRLPSASNLCGPCSWGKGLLRITEPQHRDPTSSPTNVCPRSSNGTRGAGLASLLSALDLQICRLDRRPVLGAKTFAHLYIVEVDDGDRPLGPPNGHCIIPGSAGVVGDMEGCCGNPTDLQSNKPLTQLEGGGAWVRRLREAAGRVMEAGGDAEVLGCW